MQRLAEMQALLGDNFSEVIDLFIRQTGTDLDRIVASVDSGDAAECRMASHAIKSNSLTLGLDDFSELMRVIEQNASEGKLDAIGGMLDDARRQYDEIVIALSRYVE